MKQCKCKIDKKIQGLLAQVASLRERKAKNSSTAKVKSGEIPAPAIAALIKSQNFSFAVVFVRSKEPTKPKNKRLGLSFTSDRRFATLKEANQHGYRFKSKHRHAGYHTIKVAKRANSWVNWATGKTNPVA